MRRSRKIVLSFAILISGYAAMGGLAIAQIPKIATPADYSLSAPGLATVAESLDYSQFQAPRMPSDLPTVPDTGAFVPPPQPSLALLPESADTQPTPNPDEQNAVLTHPWWAELKPISGEEGGERSIELEDLVWMAIENSPYVKSLLIEPQILEARANSTLGTFDPTPFINSLFNDSSNPVGNTLTTGGPSRLNENLWENSAGVKAKTQTGAQTELAQEMNFHASNSVFFLPNNQADSRMVLRYTQPLMRGAGTTYNCSSFVIAELSSRESIYEVTTKIQQHAFTIATNYWELFYARANYEQAERGLVRLIALRKQLAGRADLDSLLSQLLRADSQISLQRAQQASAKGQVAGSEAKLRAAVGSAELFDSSAGVLIPRTMTADRQLNFDLPSELGQALQYHPSIQATHTRLKAAKVRLHVAENELRPTLNLVMEGYARGLNGDNNFGSSLGDQFSQGAPSYAAGMTYQRPFRNTTANAILREKRLELQKLLFDLDNVLLTVSSQIETEIAAANGAFAVLDSAVRSTLAAHAELEYLTARWGNAFLDSNQGGNSLLLDQLLNANVQLIQAENSWARAQADYMLALARVRLASGTLLSVTEPLSN